MTMIYRHDQALYLHIYLLDGFTNVCIHMILIQTTCSMYACLTTESFHTSNTIAFTFRVKLLQKMELTDRDANVDFICKHIADTWGNNWILVSGDGIEISDCPATRGEHRNLR